MFTYMRENERHRYPVSACWSCVAFLLLVHVKILIEMRNQNKCYDDSYLVKQNTKRFLKFGGTGLNPAENQYISFFLSLPSAL